MNQEQEPVITVDTLRNLRISLLLLIVLILSVSLFSFLSEWFFFSFELELLFGGIAIGMAVSIIFVTVIAGKEPIKSVILNNYFVLAMGIAILLYMLFISLYSGLFVRYGSPLLPTSVISGLLYAIAHELTETVF